MRKRRPIVGERAAENFRSDESARAKFRPLQKCRWNIAFFVVPTRVLLSRACATRAVSARFRRRDSADASGFTM
jgi:hypothetical protein